MPIDTFLLRSTGELRAHADRRVRPVFVAIGDVKRTCCSRTCIRNGELIFYMGVRERRQ